MIARNAFVDAVQENGQQLRSNIMTEGVRHIGNNGLQTDAVDVAELFLAFLEEFGELFDNLENFVAIEFANDRR